MPINGWAALALALWLLGCSAPSPTTKTMPQRTPCAVLQVFDGDTLACDLNHNHRVDKPTEHIRLLGIDTPETKNSKRYRHNPRKAGHNEPYAQEAFAFLKQATDHKTVYLEFDLKRTDRYGRTLAFVYVSPTTENSLNYALVANGLANTLFIEPNRKNNHCLTQALVEARKARRGIWSK